MKRSNKNLGFTLTEVLIAVVILAFGAIPIMANFVQSGKLNQKAKENMNATNMAESIMEGVSAYSATDIIKMFESEQNLRGTILFNDNFTSYEEHGDCDNAWNPVYTATPGSFVIDDNLHSRQYASLVVSGNTINVNKSSDGNYRFYVKNLEQGKNKYDLRLTLATNRAAKNQTNGSMSKLESSDKTNNVNGQEFADIVQMETPYDASEKLTSSDFEDMIAAFQDPSKTSTPSKFGDVSTWQGKIKRNVEIEIKNIAADPSVDKEYVVAMKSVYEVPNAGDCAYFGLNPSDNKVEVHKKQNISMTEKEELPRNIYIFYQGLPGSTKANKLDTFNITNTTGEEITVYVIRTVKIKNTILMKSSTLNNTTIDAEFSSGFSTSEITDYGVNIIVNDAASNTEVVTNAKLDPTKTYDSTKEFDDSTQPAGLYDTDRAAYTYVPDKNAANEINTDIHIYDGYKKTKKDFLYTAYLEVYQRKNGILKKVASFNGGLTE